MSPGLQRRYTERSSFSHQNVPLAICVVGSELDKQIKETAARDAADWEGIGDKPQLRVWRIEKFAVTPWPEDRYGEFHKGDSYIVLNSYRKGSSDALNHDIHIWIGSESSQDEYGTAGKKRILYR